MKYELSEQIKQNLMVFLNRVELKGSEVIAYVDVVNALSNPIQDNNINLDKKEE